MGQIPFDIVSEIGFYGKDDRRHVYEKTPQENKCVVQGFKTSI